MWGIIGDISSLCSIFGLLFAIVQIFKIKSRTEDTKKAIDMFLVLERNNNLNVVYDFITKQQDKITAIQSLAIKQGVNNEKINRECEEVINFINLCINYIPSELNYISDDMKKSIDLIKKYNSLKENSMVNGSGSPKNDYLNDASAYLYTAINRLKEAKEGRLKTQAKYMTGQTIK